MKQEINYAKVQKQIDGDTPLDMCYRLGQTHRAYGWVKMMQGHWNPDQIEAYKKGYSGGTS